MLPHVIVDGQLITGQNPYSTNALAEAIVIGLNKKLVDRQPYDNERTRNLIKKQLTRTIWFGLNSK